VDEDNFSRQLPGLGNINDLIYNEIQKTHNLRVSNNPILVTNISNLQVNISHNNPITYLNNNTQVSNKNEDTDEDSIKKAKKNNEIIEKIKKKEKEKTLSKKFEIDIEGENKEDKIKKKRI